MNKKRVGIYIRVSTDKQVREGYSIAAQKRNLTDFALKQNWDIIDIYSDEGISGKNIEDRLEVKRLINDVIAKNVDIVLLYKFDRLTRDSKDTEMIISLIQKYGIEVITLSGENVDVSTATGRFSIRISGAVAQLEREQTIERIKVALKQKVKEGYTLASITTCYGYERKKHSKLQTIKESEAKIIKQIFSMFLSGKTFNEISCYLNINNIPTKMNGRKLHRRNQNDYYVVSSMWTSKMVRLILNNPTYIGKVRYHVGKQDELIFDGKHEPIIDKEMWLLTQQKLLKIKKRFKTKYSKAESYYCGSLICGICGHKLTTTTTIKKDKLGHKRIFYGYRCINQEKGRCTNHGVSHIKVEKAFLQYLKQINSFEWKEYLKALKKESLDTIEINLEKNLKSLVDKKSEIMELFIFNKIDVSQFEVMNNKIIEKINLLEREIDLNRWQNSSISYNKDLDTINLFDSWLLLTNKEKLQFLINFIESIEIINNNLDKHNGLPNIITVKWYE